MQGLSAHWQVCQNILDKAKCPKILLVLKVSRLYTMQTQNIRRNESGITVDLNMYNIVTSPPQYESDLSCRYLLICRSMQGKILICQICNKVYYSPAGATISELKPYDKEKNIYYVEISFPNPVYARTYVQFCIYYYENKLWDSSNDFSYQV